MSKESYIQQMLPWAKKAEQATGLPYDFIVAQWGWETGWGTNRGSKTLNNHAGIKYSKYAPAGTVKDGMYAKYPNMDTYIKDYTRVMNLSYYTAIKSARTDKDRVVALNVSPWSESDYDINTMLSAQKIARELGGGVAIPSSPSSPSSSSSPSISTPTLGGLGELNISSMNTEDLQTWASVGIALAILLTLIPKTKNA